MTNDELLHLGGRVLAYCQKFNVPLEFLFEILEDQKVTPMIRGKAMEYNVFLKLLETLPRSTWSVQKLNLNAQTGLHDEDVSVTHRRTGIILKVESKSAVRGSINSGLRARHFKVPHFKVKCHRSRSNIQLAGTSNDRYSVDSFDIIVTNTTNAVFEGNTVGETLELIHNASLKEMLFHHYSVNNERDLVTACENDWRFCIPSDIAVDGFIPRTPYVLLENDKSWRSLDELEERLLTVVEEKRRTTHISRRN
jgi:hypothetical protein